MLQEIRPERIAVVCLAAAVPWLAPVPQAGGDDFSFDGRRALAIGLRPGAVELADLDADGDLDLIAVNTGEFAGNQWNGSSVQVFLNPGDGAFEASDVYLVPNAPWGLAVCDLTGDGMPDLVTPNTAPDTLTVLENDGDGRFALGSVIPVGIDPVGVVCADFDGMNGPDLASADQFGFGVSVALNLGGGTFAPSEFYALGDLINDLQAGDVDNDDNVDLVAFGNQGPVLLRNDGSGAFGPPEPLAELGSVSSRSQLCRFNTDVDLDLVSGSRVWLGQGDGTFDPTGIPTGLVDDWVRCLDFDGDGNPDVVTGAALALGNGDGTVAAPIDFDPPPHSGPIACGDFVEDDELDMVRLQGGVGGPIGFATLLPGRGGGTVPVLSRFAAGDSVWTLACGLLDADDHLDLVVGNVGTPFGQYLNGSVSLLPGYGDGTFGPLASTPAGDRVRALELGHLNDDGALDVVVTNFDDAAIGVLLNDGAGGLAPRVLYPSGDNPEALALGDFDGMNGTDIAVANMHSGTLPGTVSVLLADGIGGFEAPEAYTLPEDRPVGLVAADLNDDEYLDLAVISSGRGVSGGWINFGLYVLFGNGDGTFAPGMHHDTTYLPRAIDACDLDLDGDTDLVVSAWGPSDTFLYVGGVQTFLNDGFGSYTTTTPVSITHDHFSMKCVDLGGDRFPDVVLPHLSSSVVTLLPGVGDGTFGEGTHYATANKPWKLYVGDLNHDGRDDIAIAHQDINEVGVLLNTGTAGPDVPAASIWHVALLALLVLVVGAKDIVRNGVGLRCRAG